MKDTIFIIFSAILILNITISFCLGMDYGLSDKSCKINRPIKALSIFYPSCLLFSRFNKE